MQRLSFRSISLIAGLVLAVAGLALVVAVMAADGATTQTPVSAAPAVGGVTADAASLAVETTAAAASEGTATGSVAVSTPAAPTPEPFWRVKQRAAEAAQKQREQALAASTATTAPQTTATTAGTRALAAIQGQLFPTPAPPLTNTTRVVIGGGQTPLRGVWAGEPEAMVRYLLASNPSPHFTVPPLTLARYYVRYGAEAGLRADVLWSQMLLETGFGKYGGSVSWTQNNFAGIGATGGGVAGHGFPTAEAGVKAQVAHLAAYVYTNDVTSWTNALTDPRYNAVNPRGIARVLSDLDGRWAVPGIGYGANIERHVAAINR